jgi:DNA modification methylase
MRANRLSDEEIREIIDQIICGDALEVLPRLPANSVDLVLTDPPYFLDKLEQNCTPSLFE